MGRIEAGLDDGKTPFAAQVKGAAAWRAGSQLAGQLITWTATFMVLRLLTPADYGMVAMADVLFTFLNLMAGWGFASALIRAETLDPLRVRQVFGMLLLMNGALAGGQFLIAPYAAAYFHQPMVADLLRVQALLYLATPFMAVPNALLARRMEFRRQGQVQLLSACVGAATALACALNGWGVWTLIVAPAAAWWTRAIGLTLAARFFMMPSFRFAGAGALASYGGAMVLVQFCWFAQAHSDVFIGGHVLPAAELGIYTTALFLTQILTAKFIPPLNEVAFAAYSQIQGDRPALRWSFLKAVRLILIVALPFYFGLAATAEPLVTVVLGEQWVPTARVIPILAPAMALLTLQILFAPATNAIGRPRIAVHTGLAGALILPAGFLIGIAWGIEGLSWAWAVGTALLLIVTAGLSLPALGLAPRDLARAVAPGLAASAAMAAAVVAVDLGLLTEAGSLRRLAVLVPLGGAAYLAFLFLFARPVIAEALALARRTPVPAAQAL